MTIAEAIEAKAEEILSTITTSGGGNPRDTDYSWTGKVFVEDGISWFEITHAEYSNFWLSGEMREDEYGTEEHVFREDIN